MKKLILIFLLFSICFYGLSQNINLEGEWKGTITLDTNQNHQVMEFSIRFRQSGNAVWGIYVKGKDNTADCTGRLIAGLNSKNGSEINIFQDGIEENNIPIDLCYYLNFLQADYSKAENTEYLKGRWFGNSIARRYGADVASGSFQLEKISPVTDIEVDKYFPNLARLIKKFNSN